MNLGVVENLRTIQNRIHAACIQANRNPNSVRLLLATKTVTPDNIKIAINQGESLIGENKIQEIKEKFEALKDIPHEKHFIGHLQSNKIKDILNYNVSCMQTLDRLSLAEKLNNRLKIENKNLNVLIQVNTSYEESKFGIAPENAMELITKVSKLENLHIKGLMTIGIFSGEENKVRNCFKLLKKIQEDVIKSKISNVEMRELSMGMSGDLEIAIAEGATIVRVGTAIFGERIHPDSYYWNESV